METDLSSGAAAPLLGWKEIAINNSTRNLPLSGPVHDILILRARSGVLRESGVIVLACARGVLWARIPQPGSTYNFHIAVDEAGSTLPGCTSLAEGPLGSVIAAAEGAVPGHVELHHGLFLAGDLVFSPATIDNVDKLKMRRTSVASCQEQRNAVYAATADEDGGLLAVLKSVDGGKKWVPTGNDVTVNGSFFGALYGGAAGSANLPGKQGDHNNCIAVSYQDPEKVVVGWQNAYFVSTSGGAAWEMIDAYKAKIHSDFQAISFDSFDATQERLYVCSDGGIVVTENLGASHNSILNSWLPNTQFTRMAHNDRYPELIAASAQDNGNQWCQLYPEPQPWMIREGGDGRAIAFTRGGELLHLENAEDLEAAGFLDWQGLHIDPWDPAKHVFRNNPYFTTFPTKAQQWGLIPVDDQPGKTGLLLTPGLTTGGGLRVWPLEKVNTPTWRNGVNEPMIAVAGVGNNVYGLFASLSLYHWSPLAQLPGMAPSEVIFAVGSNFGFSILVGTNKARIIQLTDPQWDAATKTSHWTALPMEIENPGDAEIFRFSIHTDQIAFATTSQASVLKLKVRPEDDSLFWSRIRSPASFLGNPASITFEDTKCLETDWTPGRFPNALFAATETRVFWSSDLGDTWVDISSGLPANPHCTDIRFGFEDSGACFLHLSTYGWSAWRKLLNAIPERTRTVSLSRGDMGLTIVKFWGDDKTTPPILPQSVTLSALSPLGEMSVSNSLDYMTITLTIRVQYKLDDSVDVNWAVHLNNSNDGGGNTAVGTFSLPPGAQRYTNAYVQYDSDNANVNFMVDY